MSETSQATAALQAAAWDAELRLGFARIDAATRLVERAHRGPLRVQKALYPEGAAVAQAIVLHPPSGIAGGDRLHIAVNVGPQAHAQLTTPGAGKWYRSAGAEAAQTLDFRVRDGGVLEWLPQETIVFNGARCRMQTRVGLEGSARYIGWEILCLGRRAAGERYTRGHLDLMTRIERDGQPMWHERGRIKGDDPLLASRVGWAGASVSGTLMATLPPTVDAGALLAACREIAPAQGVLHGVTALPGVLLARYLGDNSEAARLWFVALWQRIRLPLLGRAALPPRIWTT